MTTAHRPTWKAAVGKASDGGWSAGGNRSSHAAVLNLAAHTKLKVRHGDQVVDRKKALKESLLKLEQAEKKAASSSSSIGRRNVSPQVEEEGRMKLLKQTAEVDEEAIRKKYQDKDADAEDDNDGDSGGGGGGWSDLDHSDDDDLDASSDESDLDDSEDEDDEAALQAELAKIRAERESAKQQQAAEEAKEEERKMEEAALLGNPLLNSDGNSGGTGKFKRKWNDDVVFRNQAKDEPKIQKRFINDTVRNDFHKRFLNKFIH